MTKVGDGSTAGKSPSKRANDQKLRCIVAKPRRAWNCPANKRTRGSHAGHTGDYFARVSDAPARSAVWGTYVRYEFLRVEMGMLGQGSWRERRVRRGRKLDCRGLPLPAQLPRWASIPHHRSLPPDRQPNPPSRRSYRLRHQGIFFLPLCIWNLRAGSVARIINLLPPWYGLCWVGPSAAKVRGQEPLSKDRRLPFDSGSDHCCCEGGFQRG